MWVHNFPWKPQSKVSHSWGMIRWMKILFWDLHQTVENSGSPGVTNKFFCQISKSYVCEITCSISSINVPVGRMTFSKEYRFEKASVSLPALEPLQPSKANFYIRFETYPNSFLFFFVITCSISSVEIPMDTSILVNDDSIKNFAFFVRLCTKSPKTHKSNVGSTRYPNSQIS